MRHDRRGRLCSRHPGSQGDQPITLSWTPAISASDSTGHVKLDISHHGGSKGKIECKTADSGSLTLSASLLGQLVDLGISGFPTIVVNHSATGSATVSAGRIDLVLESSVEKAIEIPGLVSCNGDEDCPVDKPVCQDDLQCK